MADRTFPHVPADLDFPRDERQILEFWKRERIFEATLNHRQGAPTFVFYEGPPTANGLPHNGHVLTRVMKDLFPRYKTMRGFRVPRKAGWDTHGLPVEVEVEKELHIHGKAAIEAYGVEPFTRKCIESVFRYTADWEKLTERIGFWVDLPDAYVTYHRAFVESVWWALAELFKKGLLYRGHKVVWWWAQGGTALSSGEVGQGYKTVFDPSLFVAFDLVDEIPGLGEAALAVWTTTPWTLPSNMYAAVKVDADYVAIDVGGRRCLVAGALAPELARKMKGTLVEGFSCKGSDLIGKLYIPPFDLYYRNHADDRTTTGERKYWRVLGEDFVTLSTGTGIVHIAPAFGEDDNRAFQRLQRTFGEDLELFCAVKADGTFLDELTAYAGRWVKDADKDIQHQLKQEGKVLLVEQYQHEYPFCWRADSDPLIQFARPAWYVRTTSKIERALENNQAIHWLPEHIREGRFGDFLRNNVDWALSRERYWGTPLPIWQNEALPEDHPQRFVAIESLAELRAQKNCNLAAVEAEVSAAIADEQQAHHLLVHKPWIDRVTFELEGIEGIYRRVPEVIDCWFDSGCMPFAQWGFPHQPGSHEKLREAFPADFISEAIDQTRGWFYSLLMVSTLLFDEENQKKYDLRAGVELPHPYRSCIVLGHVCDKEGKKESKSKGNYTPPDVILERVGMDFVVVDGSTTEWAHLVKPGTALICSEDYEGLDLGDAAAGKAVPGKAHRRDRPDDLRDFQIVPIFEKSEAKKLPRRKVLLHPDDLAAMGLVPPENALKIKPSDVPSLPTEARLYLEDPTTPPPGADAFRWFFYASSPPWTNTRHALSNVRALQKDFLVKLRNVYSFFTIYANIDRWTPTMTAPPPSRRPLLCRWILSELSFTIREVTDALDRYQSYEAAQRLMGFVEALSNWYLRRSRERFWGPDAGERMGDDKRAAYATLHHCLATLSLLIAPFTPFFAEQLYQGLVVQPGIPGARRSVHLEDFPSVDSSLLDPRLSSEMAAVREVVSLGLQVRNASKVKVRQPLARLDIVLSQEDLRASIEPHRALILDELNVKQLTLLEPGSEGQEVCYRLKPNFKALGPKVGKKVQQVKQILERADAGALRAEMANHGQIRFEIDGEPLLLGPEDIEIAVEAAEGFAAAGGKVGVVILHTQVTPELKREGLARELQSVLQTMRKERKIAYEARIPAVWAATESAELQAAFEEFREVIEQNVLIPPGGFSIGLPPTMPPLGEIKKVEIEGEPVVVQVQWPPLSTHPGEGGGG
ncbi:MAG: isoleucine--tRNA ligase [Myxococcales bacterium]|nr:isoleucine--tRNA ligase [Myxococcales bacterium]